MNDLTPESQAKIEALVQWIADNAVKGGEFVKEQAPDVAREIVAWGVWDGACTVGIGLLVGIPCLIASAKMARKFHKVGAFDSDPGKYGGLFVAMIVCSFAGLIGTVIGLTSIPRAVKPLVAPKVYLLEQLRVLK